MGLHSEGEIEELLGRARDVEASQSSRADKGKRYVFQGNTSGAPQIPFLQRNKQATRRKYSTFNIILALFTVAIVIVAYVSNIIAVRHLAQEVSVLETKHNSLVNQHAILRAEISRTSSWERIGMIATERIGLQFPKEQPHWIVIDIEQSEKLEE